MGSVRNYEIEPNREDKAQIKQSYKMNMIKPAVEIGLNQQ